MILKRQIARILIFSLCLCTFEIETQFFLNNNIQPLEIEENVNEDTVPEPFERQLSAWALRNRITHCSMKELLALLKSNGHANLPSDPRTFFKTPRTAKVIAMGTGEFCHFNLKDQIINCVLAFQIKDTSLKLTINVDGLPIFKSTNYSLWLLLGYLDGTFRRPFVISVYGGYTKPETSNFFLKQFIDDMKEIKKDGILIENVLYTVHLKFANF